ncbi:uncharacterized protein [Neodiprion pinetum]|uniref:uncharacterized protein n=1 Tax=Neodiprion pinetum TaxID=441929 RepID=UPI003710FFF5
MRVALRKFRVFGVGRGGGRGRQGDEGGRGFVLGITRGGYRWLFEVVEGGHRLTRRRTRKTRKTRWTRRTRICARYNPRWLEVVELDEVEDEDSCSFCAPPSDPLVHILRRDIAVLRIKK